jgi:two-component system cell cycle response regulator
VTYRPAKTVSWVAGGGLLAVLAYFAHTLGVGGPALDDFFGTWVYTGVELLGVALCAWRGLTVRSDRAAWLAMAAAMFAWVVGDGLWTFWLDNVDNPPFPSLADAAYYVNYVVSYAALVLLLRARVRQWRLELWLDGLIGGLALTALSAAVVFEPIREATHGSTAVVAFNLAYPILDLVLLGFVVVAFGVSGWRPGRQWTLLGLGLVLTAVADGVFAYQEAAGTYVDGTWLDPMWPASMLAIGWAAWQRPSREARAEMGWGMLAILISFTLLATGLLVAGQVWRIGGLAAALAAAALVVGIARATLTFAENLRLLERSRREAVTDGLSGLPNRRALLGDLERVLAERAPAAVVFFDLDGFKQYNDSFGHSAGDALLRRLGQRLAKSVADAGTAYRLGGDEFCVVLEDSPDGRAERITAAASALVESGEGFDIAASYGVVTLPDDAADASTALKLADERMYDHKSGRGTARRAEARGVLLQVLSEREPALHEHIDGVARLALATAREYGLSAEDCDVIARAAELHDIGKLAIPDAILGKPGPLDPDELELMRRHTVVGERILVAAPALRPVARLVRASHERWDGTGYPDRLAGLEIPLGARIIAVCDAYDAMTTDRPYRAAMPAEAALRELRRCAGTQFDVDAVRAFCAAVGHELSPTG